MIGIPGEMSRPISMLQGKKKLLFLFKNFGVEITFQSLFLFHLVLLDYTIQIT
jgi:hypothetical protein